MSESKHTPGPWFVEENGYCVAAVRPGRCNTPIAYLPLEFPNREANAPLIAASPELLEGAKACLAAHLYGNAQRETIAWISILESAIAKVEGRLYSANQSDAGDVTEQGERGEPGEESHP